MFKLYKFRSLQKFEYTADIILENRLYAADFETMNDVLEGVFWYENLAEDILKQIKDEKKKLKICSMSAEEAFSNPLMWAHYADSFKGVCLEFEVDPTEVNVARVLYDNSALKVTIDFNNLTNFEDNWAKDLLCKKYSDWEYEKEYRIFSNSEFITNGIQLKKIYLGVRISDANKTSIQKITPSDVDIVETDFDGDGKVKAR